MINKKVIIALLVLVLLTINFSAAHEVDNLTSDDSPTSIDWDVLKTSDVIETTLKTSGQINTRITVNSTVDFDVVGDYFKVKLTDADNKALKNTKITFTVNGVSYNKNTDSNGIASFQIRLNDGTYKIVSKFAGNSNYKSSSITTKITMDNTREVASGLSSSEIQQIIDNAKINNVILFEGSSYSDINLIITKSLILLSNVDTTLTSSINPVITVKGKSASITTVKGFKIKCGGDGISLRDVDYVKIINNDIASGGEGIVAVGTKYLNISKNDISKNTKSGISLADSTYTYIFNNNIRNNGENGIQIAKSSQVYIHGNTISNNNQNGVYLAKKINGVNYGRGPDNIYLTKNTISKNDYNGVHVYNARNNIQIKGNSIKSNTKSGISITSIGSNSIQSNVIADNAYVGIKFNDDYVKPKNQDISYNAIIGNGHREVEAKETYYSENGQRLDIGDNWYGGAGVICPKIKSNNLKFTVSQIGTNTFQATFTDSNGNIASLLPDRTLSYWIDNGHKVTMTISGGAATFNVDFSNGVIVKTTVDDARVNNAYDSNSKSTSKPINGQTTKYSYSNIPHYQLYEDIGKEYGNGEGGSGQGSSNGNNDNVENSTRSQKQDLSNNVKNQENHVSQNYETQDTTFQDSGYGESSDESISGSQSRSVVKQILLDEDDFFRVTGMSFIILLIILTVAFYYRDDIKELNSKR